MLVLVVVLMAIATGIVAANRRDRLSFYFVSLCASLVIMLCGVVTYIAKMGGYNTARAFFLFLVPKLQIWLRDRPIPLSQLGYTVALGRCLFPYFLVCIGIYHTHIDFVRRNQVMLNRIHLGITIFFLIYSLPTVFKWVVQDKIWRLVFMRRLTLCWIIFCVAEALFLVVQEYVATTSPYFKRTYRFIVLAILSVTGLYSMYAVQDPGQIYNFYVSEYIQIGSLSYLVDILSSWVGWLTLIACTVFFVGLGTVNLVRFSRIGQSEQREEASLQRKFDTASMGASVFVHSIKNQLLSARVVHKKLNTELQKPEPDMGRIQELAAMLASMNETMLARMEELYQSVKSSYIELVPVDSGELVQAALTRVHQKYPDAKILVDQQVHDLVLADKTHMAEALYNLLTNAWEAAQSEKRPEGARVEFSVTGERLWLDFNVVDNGPGLSRAEQKKIFDPFYTSKNTNYNWGMGLYYVRKITYSHLGHLQIHGREGEGSTFTIMLPRYVPKSESDRKRKGVRK